MHNLNDFKDKDLFSFIDHTLPKKYNEIFTSKSICENTKYPYKLYEDLSETIMKKAIKEDKFISNDKNYICYFHYNKELYLLEITYDLDYNFRYRKINKRTKNVSSINLNKLLKNMLSLKKQKDFFTIYDLIYYF